MHNLPTSLRYFNTFAFFNYLWFPTHFAFFNIRLLKNIIVLFSNFCTQCNTYIYFVWLFLFQLFSKYLTFFDPFNKFQLSLNFFNILFYLTFLKYVNNIIQIIFDTSPHQANETMLPQSDIHYLTLIGLCWVFEAHFCLKLFGCVQI